MYLDDEISDSELSNYTSLSSKRDSSTDFGS